MTIGSESHAGLWARWGARLYNPFLAVAERRGMAARRRALLASAHGCVLELGAGTGLNLAHHPAGAAQLVLTEPEAAMRARLERRVAWSGREATIVAARAEALPFDDGAFDTVVSTLVLCTVGDPVAAVREVRRVLAPGGRLLFLEHVRAPSPRLARWQDRLARPWHAFAQGCRCNLPTETLNAARRAKVPAYTPETITHAKNGVRFNQLERQRLRRIRHHGSQPTTDEEVSAA